MLITELLDTNVPIDVVQNTPTKFRANFVAGDQQYYFLADTNDHKADPSDPDNMWYVEFAHQQHRPNGSHATGTGEQFKVFAAVKQLMDSLVSSKIETADKGGLIYEGTTLEPARLRLYKRYAQTLLNRPGWRVSNTPHTGWFVLVYNQ